MAARATTLFGPLGACDVTTMAAVDLGAQSGRVALGDFDGSRISVREIHRFANIPVRTRGTLYWDVLRLYEEVLEGLTAAGGETRTVDSVGIDTWGVDFGLLDRDGRLVQNPVHHRDRRTDGAMDALFAEVPAREVYERTGIQLMPINTLVQLYAAVTADERSLEIAETLLLMPDLLHYWLSGVAACEYTNATTTQCLDPRAQAWDVDLLERLGIPSGVFPEVVRPATVLGALLDGVADRTRLRRVVVVTPATHDTASAVAAVPFRDRGSAYISAGTWSLVGMELRAPQIDDLTFAANLTNEGGIGGTVRLLRNVNGLWLLHECQRTWASQGDVRDVPELVQLAEQASPFRSFIDPNDPVFLPPGDMPSRIREYCVRTNQPVPEEPGAVVRCIFESLALKFRQTIELLARVTGATAPELHIVGGGARNRLLCQWTADATGVLVLAGPEEATLVGNLIAQAIALGELASLEEAREVVRASFEPTLYEPARQAEWGQAYARFEEIVRGQERSAEAEIAAR
jgi:rhamnulokinase